MGLCVDLGYEVVTDTVTVSYDNNFDQEVRIAAPSGKMPVGAGIDLNRGSLSHGSFNSSILRSSYPDGNEWVFVLNSFLSNLPVTVDLYVVCVNV
jgi:hypothetical protein